MEMWGLSGSSSALDTDGNDARRAIMVFYGRVDAFTVFGPAEAAFRVNFDEVRLALFPGEVADTLGVKSRARADGEVEVAAGALVKPVEKVFEGGLRLPVRVVRTEVGAVTMLYIRDHA